ncbi:MAG: hypothetical protein IBJ00_07455 [Alphaproteobacteria bacterium]|nr:hypothetical protein [Alphaproteobacteria bacterium]
MLLKKFLLLSTIVSYPTIQFSLCNATSPLSDTEEQQAIMLSSHQTYDTIDSLDNTSSSGSLDATSSPSHPIQKVSTFKPFIVDYKEFNKALLALAFLPAVDASAEDTTTNFYGAILPTVAGGFICSALLAPILKDGIYKGYQSFASSRFDKLTEWLDTTIVTRWPHESLRWGYFAILRGNREIGDLPIRGNDTKNIWRSFYEWTTSQPYTVELRHAVRLKNFTPYIVKTVKALDREFEKTDSWERTELREENTSLFRGFSYQNGILTLHIRGGSPNESFEEMVSADQAEESINSEDRYKTWVKFFKPFKDNNIEALPLSTQALLERFVLNDNSDENKVEMTLTNFDNTLYFDYRRGLIIALQKNSCPLPEKEENSLSKKKSKKKQKKLKQNKKSKDKEIDSSNDSSGSEKKSKKRNKKDHFHTNVTAVSVSNTPAGTVESV